MSFPPPALSLSSSLSTPLTTSFAGAHALWWPCASRSRPKLFLLFIPGNPGLASYYIPFLNTIYHHPQLRNRVEILAVSHRGHAPLPKGFQPVWGDTEDSMRDARKGYGTSLHDQIRHKVAAVDAVRKAYPRATPVRGHVNGIHGNHVNGHANAAELSQGQEQEQEQGQEGADADGVGADATDEVQLVLCGHSVGAYIATEALRARPDAIDGLHLLFPTLSWIANTPNGRKLRPLFHPLVYTFLLPVPLFFLSLIPMVLFLPLVRFLTAQPKAAVASTVDLLRTPGAARNAIRMAAEEMSTIKSLRQEVKDAIVTFADRRQEGRKGGALRTYWSRNEEDGWAPSWLRTQVEAELNLARTHLPALLGPRIPPDPVLASTPNGGSHLVGSPVNSPFPTPNTTAVSSTTTTPRRRRTRSFSLSEYRSGSEKTRPRLQNAVARRRPSGEIVIQTTVEESDGSDEDAGGERDEAVRRAGEALRAVTRGVETRSSSTVCRVGMPHAFCLRHGEKMGEIAAHWLVADHL